MRDAKKGLSVIEAVNNQIQLRIGTGGMRLAEV
jgi:hypothetical protein